MAATQIIFSTAQASLVFFGLLASAFGVAFTLGRFSKAQDILTREVRTGFQHVNLTLATMTAFREATLQNQATVVEWRRSVDQQLQEHDRKIGLLQQAD